MHTTGALGGLSAMPKILLQLGNREIPPNAPGIFNTGGRSKDQGIIDSLVRCLVI